MAARQKKNAQPSGPGSAAELVGAISVGLTGGADGTAGSATRQAEIETKLEIAPDANCRPSPGGAGWRRSASPAPTEPRRLPPRRHLLRHRGLDLLRSKMTLRRRTGGPDAGWHLKLPAVQGARTEVGLPLAAGEPGDVPAELAGLVRGAARAGTLVPVARVENDRTVRHLLDEDGSTMIEVADDHVTATPLLDGAGQAVAMARAGGRDRRRHPGPARRHRRRADVGRCEQGVVGIETGPGTGLVRRPARRSKTAGAAVVGRAGPAAGPVDRRRSRAAGRTSSGALHDARSAARRIRAILTVYAPLFDGRTAFPRCAAALRSFGSALSTARDLDVARRRLIAQLVEEPEEYAGAARARLADAVTGG